MDALIIAIAIMLVAMVTTYVYLNTTRTLMSHDQNVAKQKEKGMQQPIVIEQVRAVDVDDDKQVDRFIILLSQRSMSDPVRFNETIVLIYSDVINCTSLLYGNDAKENCTYDLIYRKQGTRFEQDYMHSGDIVELRYTGSNLLGGNADYSSKIIVLPSEAFATTATFEFPARIYPPNKQLWPLND